jgi:hypothetical protein
VALLHRDDTDLQSVNWECSKVVMCMHLIIRGFVLFPCLRVAYDFFSQEVGVFLVGLSRYDGNDVKVSFDTSLLMRHVYDYFPYGFVNVLLGL